jgi:putative ABC transport system ATP-binding protein
MSVSTHDPVPLHEGVPVIELDAVSKVFHLPGAEPVNALRSVNLRVMQHESVAIVGPSGSGKSTLLNIIGCLDTPTSGTYRLNGVDVASLNDKGRSAIRGREIGFVFQQFHLLAHRSVLDNVEIGSLYGTNTHRPLPRRERLKYAQDALERVGLSHRMNATARTLSGGEKQRVAIARAISQRPSLLLADEPTGNLDTQNTHSVLDVLDTLQAEGLTLLLITHDLAVANRLQRRVTISDGTLTANLSVVGAHTNA